MKKIIKNSVLEDGSEQWMVRKRNLGGTRMVLLAVMCSLTVVSAVVSTNTIPIHIGTAMVVITGAALGAREGFICGAMSRFVCNFFNGHGPWTPWQMLSWGLLGAVAGVLFYSPAYKLKASSSMERQGQRQPFEMFHRGRNWKIPKNAYTLSLATFLFTFIIYGGIMNFAAMFLSYFAAPDSESVGIEVLGAVYLTGVPYDLFHAGCAAVMVFLFGMQMIRKIERVVKKYGL